MQLVPIPRSRLCERHSILYDERMRSSEPAHDPETLWQGEHYAVGRVAEGIYVARPVALGCAGANATIVDLGDRTVVVDSGLTNGAGHDLAAAARALTGRRASLVFNTHAHSDHLWGNQAFAGTGESAEFVATAGTRQLLLTSAAAEQEWYRTNGPAEIARLTTALAGVLAPERRALLEAERRFYQGALQALDDLELRLPTITFDRRFCLHGRTRTLDAVTYGGGHTRSDAVAWIPDQGVLVAGDLVTAGAHPYLGDGDTLEWLHILRTLQTQQPRIVVPGHGPVGGAEAISAAIDYIEQVLELAEGAPVDEDGYETSETDLWAGNVSPPEPYADWAFASYYGRSLRHEVSRLSRGRRSA